MPNVLITKSEISSILVFANTTSIISAKFISHQSSSLYQNNIFYLQTTLFVDSELAGALSKSLWYICINYEGLPCSYFIVH